MAAAAFRDGSSWAQNRALPASPGTLGHRRYHGVPHGPSKPARHINHKEHTTGGQYCRGLETTKLVKGLEPPTLWRCPVLGPSASPSSQFIMHSPKSASGGGSPSLPRRETEALSSRGLGNADSAQALHPCIPVTLRVLGPPTPTYRHALTACLSPFLTLPGPLRPARRPRWSPAGQPSPPSSLPLSRAWALAALAISILNLRGSAQLTGDVCGAPCGLAGEMYLAFWPPTASAQRRLSCWSAHLPGHRDRPLGALHPPYTHTQPRPQLQLTWCLSGMGGKRDGSGHLPEGTETRVGHTPIDSLWPTSLGFLFSCQGSVLGPKGLVHSS